MTSRTRLIPTTLAAVAALLIVAISSLPMTDITRAQIKRVLNIAEFLIIVDMVVVTMGAVGLFSEIQDKL